MIVNNNIARSFLIAAAVAALPAIARAQTTDTKPADGMSQDVPYVAPLNTGSTYYYNSYGKAAPKIAKAGKIIWANLAVADLTAKKAFAPADSITTVAKVPSIPMPTVKPDMSQYNMPVKRPAGDFAALAKDLNKNGAELTALPSLSIAEPSAEMAARLLGDATDDLGIVKIGFGTAPGMRQMLVTVTLPNNKGANVSLTDSEGKTIWTGKATRDKLMRTLDADNKGTYYLVVKQGKKGMVRKIVNE